MTTETLTIPTQETKTTETKPLPSYRVKLENRSSFEMFSKRGDNACKTGVKKIFKKIEGKRRLTQEVICAYVLKVINEINEKYGEVYDTEPRNHILDFTNMALKENGYSFEAYV